MAEHIKTRLEGHHLTLAERSADAVKMCDGLIEHFEKHANRSKRLFERLRYVTIVLTVAVASTAAVPQVPRWVVAVVSGIAALCATLLTAARPQEIWLQSRSTQQQLTAERFLFHQCAGSYALADEDRRIQLFSARVMEIWNAGHSRWEQGREDATNRPEIGKL